jgi:hypothetical protein
MELPKMELPLFALEFTLFDPSKGLTKESKDILRKLKESDLKKIVGEALRANEEFHLMDLNECVIGSKDESKQLRHDFGMVIIQLSISVSILYVKRRFRLKSSKE